MLKRSRSSENISNPDTNNTQTPSPEQKHRKIGNEVQDTQNNTSNNTNLPNLSAVVPESAPSVASTGQNAPVNILVYPSNQVVGNGANNLSLPISSYAQHTPPSLMTSSPTTTNATNTPIPLNNQFRPMMQPTPIVVTSSISPINQHPVTPLPVPQISSPSVVQPISRIPVTPVPVSTLPHVSQLTPEINRTVPLVTTPTQIPTPVNTVPMNAGIASPQTPAPNRQVKFENALDFLDQVKLQFANQPRVYNQFLDIMKDFKAQCIDTPGVIARVSELFKGHKNLILGFNTFLPPGYKIEHVPDDEPPEVTTPAQTNNNANANPPPVPPTQQQQGPISPNSRASKPEFDHARNYVKKIKMRFFQQPHIYKAFLEILHTYHKEQHTIKDVYEQVATLFRDHPDLLDEFTGFLPDPMANQGAPVTGAAPRQNKKATRAKGKTEKVIEKPVIEKTERVEKRKPPQSQAAPATRKREKAPTFGPDDKVPNGSYEELNFFYRVKQRLNNQSLYTEFLKCLNMFSQGIVSKVELVLLVKDLLSRYTDLFEWFKQFIGFTEQQSLEMLERSEERQASPDLMQSRTPQEIDFKTCKRYGPSYRALPKTYVQPLCSGRTPLCNEVLNDFWVSVPTGSEEYGFKNMRKNQYEEMLFKCEDDRYEIDLLIESNTSTIKTFEAILKMIQDMSEDEVSKFRLDVSVDIIVVRCIERLYAERSTEVIEALYENPQLVIPVLLKRFKTKDVEWRAVRKEWNKIWREVSDKNYYKSLDHQSFFFKQNDKKNLSPKALIAEIKQKYQEQLKAKERLRRQKQAQELGGKPSDVQHGNMEETAAPEEKIDIMEEDSQASPNLANVQLQAQNHNLPDDGPQHHLKFKIVDPIILTNIFELIIFAAEKNLPRQDREKVDTFIKHFIRPFFSVEKLPQPVEIAIPQTRPSSNSNSNSNTGTMEVDIAPVVPITFGVLPEHQKHQLFYGNATFYVFFRLFQICYDRLAKAKELARSPPNNSQFAFLLAMSQGEDKPESEHDKWKSFMKSLYAFCNASKEQTIFEDECRALFGTQAYVLFTLDKVIVQLTKQIQTLLADEICSRLLALYSYEWSRTTGPNVPLYHSNSVEILRDERCYKFDFYLAPELGAFTIQLLDSVHNPPQFHHIDLANERQDKWSQYVDNYTAADLPNLDVQKHRIFLTRLRKKCNEEKMLKNTINEHGLECRISLKTFRIFWVENTQDFFCRFKRRKARQPKNKVGDLVEFLTKVGNKGAVSNQNASNNNTPNS